MTGLALYEVRIAGATPVLVESDGIGDDEVRRIRIGELVLVVSPELADDLADSLIGHEADRSAAVQLL